MSIDQDIVDMESTYYISGPMTGYPEYNYPYFNTVKLRLQYLGFKVVSPVDIEPVERTPGMSEDIFWSRCIERCVKMMDECDAIILLSGWPKSKGARLELTLALERSWPIYYYLDPPGRLLNMMGARRP